jgi:hypothetical protein
VKGAKGFIAHLVFVATVTLLITAVDASADSVFKLTTPAKKIPGPTSASSYGTVTVDLLNPLTARITLDAAEGYWFGGNKAFDLNVSGRAKASGFNISGLTIMKGLNVPGISGGNDPFDLLMSSQAGWRYKKFTELTFTLTRKDWSTWEDSQDVLDSIGNWVAAAHVYTNIKGWRCNRNVDFFVGATPYNMPPPPVPVPGSLLLLAPGLAGLVAWRRKVKK